MKIISKINSIPFKRNQEIKKGDDIQRHSRKNFPAFSPTYADTFYHLRTKTDKRLDSKFDAVKIARNCIRIANNNGMSSTLIGTNCEHTLVLNHLKNFKIGNCEEFSIATLATLLANGYTDAERKYLYAKTEFINKKTGEVEYSAIDSLDHVFVVSALGTNAKEEKDKFVIDSWLGFADTIDGAKNRYKQLSEKRKILREKASFRRSMFRLEKLEKENILINTSDYIQKSTLFFKDADFQNKVINEELKKYVDIMYPSLKLPKKEKK